MKKLEEFLAFENFKERVELIYDTELAEDYIPDVNDVSPHAFNRYKGDFNSGGVPAKLSEVQETIFKCDNLITNYCLNRKSNSNINCGIQLYDKDKSSIVVAGYIYNFNKSNCTYRFYIMTGRKFLHNYKWGFKNSDELIINNDNTKRKIEINKP